jgi:MFS transporter, OFA family, oxalate/formate antiporter
MSGQRFHGWFVAIASGVGLACGIATVVVATFGVFLGPLRAEFGWSQSDAFAALLAVTLAAAALAPVVGGVVDRLGARPVILASFVCEAIILASFYYQSESLLAFYARYVALAVFGLGTTHVAFARVISLWFDRRRGLALGIALSGIGVGGFTWPILSHFLIEAYGWRLAYVGLSATILAVALPVVGLVIRDTPQAMGQRVDGDPEPRTPQAAAPVTGLTLAETVRSRTYLLMLATFFLVGLAIQSIMVHLVPLLTGRGVSPMLAALAQSMLFLAVTVGRLTTGWLMDHFFAPRVAMAFLLGPIVGITLLMLGFGGWVAFAAAMLVGLAVGAEVDVIAFLTGRYFGLRSYSSIYGTFYGTYSLAGGIGPLVTAAMVDATGSYTAPLLMHTGILVVCCLLLTRFGPFPSWQAAEPVPAPADAAPAVPLPGTVRD